MGTEFSQRPFWMRTLWGWEVQMPDAGYSAQALQRDLQNVGGRGRFVMRPAKPYP
jgi:hypothetical protein